MDALTQPHTCFTGVVHDEIARVALVVGGREIHRFLAFLRDKKTAGEHIRLAGVDCHDSRADVHKLHLKGPADGMCKTPENVNIQALPLTAFAHITDRGYIHGADTIQWLGSFGNGIGRLLHIGSAVDPVVGDVFQRSRGKEGVELCSNFGVAFADGKSHIETLFADKGFLHAQTLQVRLSEHHFVAYIDIGVPLPYSLHAICFAGGEEKLHIGAFFVLLLVITAVGGCQYKAGEILLRLGLPIVLTAGTS